MKKKRKGFTLTELLVVIVILGIIAGMTIPLIRNLSATFEKKKYTSYKDSLLSSGKLYNDSYGEDLFGHNEYGCAYIPYEKLVKKDLIKDIDISDVTCNSDKTYVRVVKQKDKYGYKAFLTCGKEENGVLKEVTTSIPEVVPDMDFESCNGTANSLVVSADLSQVGNNYDKQRKTTKVKITSYTGIDNNIVIYTKWSKDSNDHGDGFVRTNFKVTGDQEATLLEGNPVTSNSKELVTPADTEGQWYLIVRVDQLQDLYGSKWKNPDNSGSKYLSFGPFSVDNTPPTIVATAYKCNGSHNKTGNSLGSKTVNGGTGALTLSGWHNGNSYPNGVCYEFKLSDNRIVKSAEWKWNKSGYKSGADGYKTLDGGTTNKSYTSGTSQTFSDYLSASGHRYAQLVVKDAVGNSATVTLDVKIDNDKPSCGTPSGSSTSWTKNNRTITQPCSDAVSGCKQSSYPDTWDSTTKTSNITITDNAGNSKDCPVNVYVDKSKPSCTIKYKSKSSSGVTVSMTCSDSGSGCKTDNISSTTLTSSKTFTVKDNVGREGSCSITVSSKNVCKSWGSWSTKISIKMPSECHGDSYKWENCVGQSSSSACGKACGNSDVGHSGNTELGCCWTRSCTKYEKEYSYKIN